MFYFLYFIYLFLVFSCGFWILFFRLICYSHLCGIELIFNVLRSDQTKPDINKYKQFGITNLIGKVFKRIFVRMVNNNLSDYTKQ